MARFAVVAAHHYDNWRIPADSLDAALSVIAKQRTVGSISDVMEYDDDGEYVRCHGTYRWGRRFSTLLAAVEAGPCPTYEQRLPGDDQK